MGKTIDEYKKDYESARLAGNAAGMQAANQGANAIRQQQGQAQQVANEDIARYSRSGSLEDKIKDNSNAWHNAATQEEKDRLHNENIQYHQQLDEQNKTQSTFNPGDGTWSTSGGNKPTQTTQPSQTVNDYSNYLAEMYAAQKKATLAQLQSAYDKNKNSFDRAEGEIAPTYQNARNQAAGQSEQAKRAFAEYAAASGLNSGAGGQAELAQNTALQNNMNEINTSESSKLADLQLKRADAETDYNNAIAQANATGDFELAKSLYAEKIRVDEAWMEQIRYETQQEQANWEKQHMLDREQTTDSHYEDQLKQQELENALALAGKGDFTKADQLGLDTVSLKNQFMAQKNKGGSSGGGGGDGSPKMTASQALTAYRNGFDTPEIRAAIEPVYGNIFGKSSAVKSDGFKRVKSDLDGLITGYGRRGESNEALAIRAANYLNKAATAGTINEAEQDELAGYVASLMKQ